MAWCEDSACAGERVLSAKRGESVAFPASIRLYTNIHSQYLPVLPCIVLWLAIGSVAVGAHGGIYRLFTAVLPCMDTVVPDTGIGSLCVVHTQQ